jgi:penicillin-binding protein 1C
MQQALVQSQCVYEGFEGRFAGPIAAEDALIRSRNVPAVAIESHLSHPNLYDFLKESEVSRLNSEQHYGLALTLGGGEVSMEELGRMYAVFVNGGRLPSLQVLATQAAKPAGAQLISPEASYITLDMLEKNPRPDTGQPAAPAVAWKTGTSWGFHDAWSVGVFDHYVLLVWIGNVDETSNPAFIGVQAAGPLLFRIIDSLRTQGLDPAQPRRPKPRNVTRVEVCAASGDLPNAECPQTVPTCASIAMHRAGCAAPDPASANRSMSFGVRICCAYFARRECPGECRRPLRIAVRPCAQARNGTVRRSSRRCVASSTR